MLRISTHFIDTKIAFMVLVWSKAIKKRQCEAPVICLVTLIIIQKCSLRESMTHEYPIENYTIGIIQQHFMVYVHICTSSTCCMKYSVLQSSGAAKNILLHGTLSQKRKRIFFLSSIIMNIILFNGFYYNSLRSRPSAGTLLAYRYGEI